MSAGEDFFDTNVVLYLRSADAPKADRAEELIGLVGTVSVQVLDQIRAVCAVEPITIETQEKALHIAERYGLSIYDALIVSAALLSGCRTLHSEDMQDGQVIEGRLTIRNPFRAP